MDELLAEVGQLLEVMQAIELRMFKLYNLDVPDVPEDKHLLYRTILHELITLRWTWGGIYYALSKLNNENAQISDRPF